MAKVQTATRIAAAARPARRVRQRRGLRTEQAILDATLQSLAARGIHATSLDSIAAEVGVAKSSILWHFGSKEGLLLRVAERAFEEIGRTRARDIMSLQTFGERSEAVWRQYTETINTRPELRRVVLYLIFESSEGRPELRARLQRLYRGMRELFAAGLREVVDDASESLGLATLAIATLDGLFLQWLLEPEALDLKALQRQVRGLAEGAQARNSRGAGRREST
jgi:AcrR family transcriptional regulator